MFKAFGLLQAAITNLADAIQGFTATVREANQLARERLLLPAPEEQEEEPVALENGQKKGRVKAS